MSVIALRNYPDPVFNLRNEVMNHVILRDSGILFADSKPAKKKFVHSR